MKVFKPFHKKTLSLGILGFVMFLAFASCNAICLQKEIDCQVFLAKNQKNPYRSLTASYDGWHFAGTYGMPTCWVGPPKFCDFCEDSISLRTRVCRESLPGFTTKPGSTPDAE